MASPVSDELALDMLGYYHRAASSYNEGMNSYPFKGDMEALKDYFNSISPSFWRYFRGALGDAGNLLDTNQLHEVMTQAGEGTGGMITHTAPGALLQFIADRQKENITVRNIFPREIASEFTAVADVASGALTSAGWALKLAPFLYMGAGLVGIVVLMKAFGSKAGARIPVRANPVGLTKTQEKKWRRAKAAVKRSRGKNYGDFNKRDWGLVQSIYQKIK